MYLSQINLRKLFVGVIFIRLTTLGYELQQNLYCFKLSQTFFFGEIELILSPSPHYECQPIILFEYLCECRKTFFYSSIILKK